MKVLILAVLCFHAALSVPVNQPLIEEQSGKFEGDIVLTAKDMVNWRTGLIDTRYRWTNNIIPYEIVDLDSDQADYVREALDEMEAALCLTFIPRTTETNYVRVTNSDSGCYSYIGMIGGGQQLNLQSYDPGTGCFRKGTIIHEFIHALGIYHMQSATERDDYVTIVWENIQAGTENNFQTHGADRISQFGVPYDYGSVMHYSATAFSVNGEPTIVPHDPDAVIGQRDGMSDSDILRIRNMYC